MGSNSAVGTALKKLMSIRQRVITEEEWVELPCEDGKIKSSLCVCNEPLEISLTDSTDWVDIGFKGGE